MRSLWTLRRDPDVWSVTTKTWQMESETIMQIKLKIIKKTNKNPFLIFASKFHQISGKEILKSFFSPLLLYRISSLLYLFFTIFAKVCSVECPSFKGQGSFMEPAERSCLFPVLKTHLWGKMWPTQWSKPSYHEMPGRWLWSQSIHRLNHCLNVYVQLAVVKFHRLRLHVCFLFRSKSFFILLL